MGHEPRVGRAATVFGLPTPQGDRHTTMKNLLFTAPLLLPLVGLHAVEPIAAFAPQARILFQGDSITDEWERTVRAFWPAAGN